MPCEIVLSRTAPNSLGIWEADGDIPLESFRRWFRSRVEVNDTVFWQRYPNGEPWFALEWKDGRISLSASHSNVRFRRNFGDMIGAGLQIAEQTKTRLFTEDGEEITAESVDELMALEGPYVTKQKLAWRETMDLVEQDEYGPLEYPMGPVDLVSPYLHFHLVVERPVEAQEMREILSGLDFEGVVAHQAREEAFCLVSSEGKWLTKVARCADRNWQVWPAWGNSEFAPIARTTLAAAEHALARTGGKLLFMMEPFDDARRPGYVEHMDGLGFDFFMWVFGKRVE